MSPARFLAEFWQKQPLMQSGPEAFRGPVLDADEAAWLATQSDVESRLVFTDRSGGRTRYRLEQGPFDASSLRALPPRDWSLLVQDVDKHLPEFRAWFRAVDYLPDWRIDDLMISVAAPGGSVGPHVDNYDVFLVQVSGNREWRIGDPARLQPDPSVESLSLLLPFEPVDQWTAAPGDVLYLPPGVPHWGIAGDLCTTYSIGMRAPTRRDLCAGRARLLDADGIADHDEDAFYTDADLGLAESAPGRIAPEAVTRLRSQQLLPDDLGDAEIADVLGAVVTDPKAWLMPDPLPAGDTPTCIHGMARLAWTEDGERGRIFVNGAGMSVERSQLGIFREWCRSRIVRAEETAHLVRSPGGRDLLDWLRRQGAFDGIRTME